MKKNNSALEYLVSFASKFKLYWLMLVIFSVVSSLIGVIVPYLTKLEMDQLVNKHPYFKWFVWDPFKIFLIIIWAILFANMLQNIQSIFVDLVRWNYWNRLESAFKLDLYERLNNVKIWFFLSKRNSYFFRELRDTWDIIDQAINILSTTIMMIVQIFWMTVVFSFIDYRIWLTLVILSLIWFVVESKRAILQEKFGIYNRYDLDKYIFRAESQLIENRHSLQISWWMKFMEDFINSYFKKIYESGKAKIKKELLYSLFSFFSSEMMTTAIKVIVGYSIFYNWSSVWVMTMTIMYVWSLRSLIFSIRGLYIRTYVWFKANFEKFTTLYEMSTERKWLIQDIGEVSEINFKDVEFAYPKISKEELRFYEILDKKLQKMGDRNSEWRQRDIHFIKEALEDAKTLNPVILKWMSLYFKKWNIYWMTTLVNLLMGFFDEFTWDISYNGRDIKNFANEVFSKRISYVSQVPYIMEYFTIRQNLLLWVDREVSQDELEKILNRFWLNEKIKGFRKWLDSEIWFDVDLSGWQRQLIALIRAILQDRQIIVFDEGTNQLDAENEMLVMKELLRDKKWKIIIFITHRMTTIKKSDMIYCIEDGKLIDFWKHDELLERENPYRNFYRTQVESKFD